MRGLEAQNSGSRGYGDLTLPVSTPTHMRHSSQTVPKTQQLMLGKGNLGHLSRKSGYDSSFAAQLAMDSATNYKVKRELEKVDTKIFRPEKLRDRDTDWNEIVRKQLFRDYPGKPIKAGTQETENKPYSNRSSSPFSMRYMESKLGKFSSKPGGRSLDQPENARASLGLGNSRDDPFDELLIGASKGKKLKRDTSELVHQLHGLKDEIKLVGDTLERLIHSESALISQKDPPYIEACEQVHRELQGPGEQDLEMRIVNFSEELEEIRKSRIPSAEQTLRYLDERRQQITALMNSVGEDYVTEQAKNIVLKIEEFQKIKNRAVENVTMTEKSLHRVVIASHQVP
jgi:hypothetical protein